MVWSTAQPLKIIKHWRQGNYMSTVKRTTWEKYKIEK